MFLIICCVCERRWGHWMHFFTFIFMLFAQWKLTGQWFARFLIEKRSRLSRFWFIFRCWVNFEAKICDSSISLRVQVMFIFSKSTLHCSCLICVSRTGVGCTLTESSKTQNLIYFVLTSQKFKWIKYFSDRTKNYDNETNANATLFCVCFFHHHHRHRQHTIKVCVLVWCKFHFR